MFKLILSSIFLIPLCGVIHNFYQPVWYTQYLGMLLFLFCILGIYLKRLDKYLSYFYLLCIFSTFFVANLSPRAIVLLFNFGLCGLASYQISKLGHEERKKIRYHNRKSVEELIKPILSLELIEMFYQDKRPNF